METSQEVNLLMDTVRRFVETEMFPHEEEIDRLGHVPVSYTHLTLPTILLV